MPAAGSKLRWGAYKKNIDNKSWAATFPDQINDLSESTIFITRCMYIAFSHILASRRLLPANIFKKRTIDGDLRAYVMNTSELLGARLVQKFKGVTEAVERGYLHELILVVNPTKEYDKDAIEMYRWRLRYDADGDPQAELRQADGTVMAALRFLGMQHLKKQVTELLLIIRTLCREILGPLPAEASSVLRITYNERAPRGYQAPGFHRSPEDRILRPDAQEIDIAAIQTKHHGVSVVVRSVFIDDSYAAELRLKETVKLDGLDDTLNESFGEEQGAGDGAHRSFNSDTMEKISGALAEEGEAIDMQQDESITTEGEDRQESPASGISAFKLRPSRGRRGQPVVTKASHNQPIIDRASSPVCASSMIETTPNREMQKDEDDDHTPPAKRTPGNVKVAKITPKEPPLRRKK